MYTVPLSQNQHLHYQPLIQNSIFHMVSAFLAFEAKFYIYSSSPLRMTQAVHISHVRRATANHKIREKTSNEIFTLLVCYAARLVVSYRLLKCVSPLLFQYWYVTISKTISPYTTLYQGYQESLTAFKSISMYLLVLTVKYFWTAVKLSWSP